MTVRIDRNQRGVLQAPVIAFDRVLDESGRIIPVNDGGSGPGGTQLVGGDRRPQLFPVDQVFADRVPPKRIAAGIPVQLLGSMPGENMVLAVKVDGAVQIGEAAATRGKVKLRTILFLAGLSQVLSVPGGWGGIQVGK